jgi:hypothetical protein
MFDAGASFSLAVSHCALSEARGGTEMSNPVIKEHMEVIGADGVHIGTVDRVENGKIRLTRLDSGEGSHKGHHHLIDLGLVAEVEGQKVRLSANAAVAVTMEEEEPRKST